MYNSAFKQSYIMLHLLFMTYQNPSALYSEKKREKQPMSLDRNVKNLSKENDVKNVNHKKKFSLFMRYILLTMFLKMAFNKVKSFKNTY